MKDSSVLMLMVMQYTLLFDFGLAELECIQSAPKWQKRTL